MKRQKLQEKQYILWLPEKTHIELKKYAYKNDTSMAAVIRRAIIKILNR